MTERLRMILTDAPGAQAEVWAMVGPIGDHTSKPELQDALSLLLCAFNRQSGSLSAERFAELATEYRAGAPLLRAALDGS